MLRLSCWLVLISLILALFSIFYSFSMGKAIVNNLDLDALSYQPPSKPVSSLPPNTNLSISVLVHPGNPEAHNWIANMKYGYTHGRESSDIVDFVVLYDGRQTGGKLDVLLQNLHQLQQNGIVQKVVQLKFEKAYADVLGQNDPHHEDQAMYATYQFIVEECRTTHCAFLTDDVMAHEGGGLNHAIRLLEENPSALVATPPLAYYFADFSNDTLRYDFHQANGSWTYPNSVGKLHIPTLVNPLMEPSCRLHAAASFSTRHLVVNRQRFLASLPWPSSGGKYLEQHQHVQVSNGRLVSPTCQNSTAFLIHPPPWNMGKRLLEVCRIDVLQKVVEHLEGLVVDVFNNMIEESWTEACMKYKADNN
jgi:hypothetical protein